MHSTAQVLLRLLLVLCFGAPAVSAEPPSNSDSDPFYRPDAVQTIELEISPENLQRMQQALPKRIIVPGIFRWNNHTLQSVGIRYKGGSSSHPSAQHKRSFLISFNEFDSRQRFLGLRNVALDNAIQFGSLFSEPLITEILRDLGVKASRCNYARLRLNGKNLGVYVNVERIDRAFLLRSFGNDQGNLFKVDQGGPGGDLRFSESDLPQVQETFEPQGSTKQSGFDQLIQLAHLINKPAVLQADLRRAFDLPSFINITAVLLFAGAFDQYTGWNPHNYYLYQNPANLQWSYIPWDLDVGFADNAFGKIPVLAAWNAAWPAPLPGRPLLEQIINNPDLLRDYRTNARSILDRYFHPDILIPKLRALHARIKPHLAEDPFPPRRVTVPSDTNYDGIVQSMENFIRQRYKLANAQLQSPGERPAFPSAPNSDEPRPGAPSPDAPTKLRAIRVTSSVVELSWKDNATGEVAHVVQRATSDGPFVNAIGQQGPHITSAQDPNVRPGHTYRYRIYAVFPTEHGPRGSGVSNEVTVQVPE